MEKSIHILKRALVEETFKLKAAKRKDDYSRRYCKKSREEVEGAIQAVIDDLRMAIRGLELIQELQKV